MAVILDASFLVDLQKQRKPALNLWRELVADGEALLVPAPAMVEFLTGSNDPLEDSNLIRQSCEFIPFGEGAVPVASRLARKLFQKGRFPGWMDVLIAAVALERDVAVVTRNPSHFTECKVRTYDTT